MTAEAFETLLRDRLRTALPALLRAHPDWTLEALFDQLERGKPCAPLLAELTIRDLLAEPAPDGGPPIDRIRLERASRLSGEAFDGCVREVLAEARGRPVAAAYLRARVGGPRWKLLNSLGRLMAAGEVERSGTTSGTRYWIGEDRTRKLLRRGKTGEAGKILRSLFVGAHRR